MTNETQKTTRGHAEDEGVSIKPAATLGNVAVPADVKVPVVDTRESVQEGECSVRLLSLMRNAEAFDRERLCYRFVKRAFDIAFSACVIAAAIVPSAVLCAAIAVESPGCPLYRQSAWGASARTAGPASSPCGSSAPW